MDSWIMHDVVCMMTENTNCGAGGGTHSGAGNGSGIIGNRIIKQEIEITSCCSPSPSTSSNNSAQQFIYNGSQANIDLNFKCMSSNEGVHLSPGSPDRQYCSSTTTPIGDLCNDNDTNSMNKEELPRRLCLVCGDIASGFHYGVASCEACKAFFKRTIQGNIEYSCPSSNECEINKRRRKACQACRFQKCLLMGMLKEGVRLDRVRGGRQKYRRNPQCNPYQLLQLTTNMPPTSLEDIKLLEALSFSEPEMVTIGHNCIELMNKFSIDNDHEHTQPHQKTMIRHPKMETNSRNVHFTEIRNENADVQETLSILSEIYDQELVGIIGWAKQIPGFIDLALNDQMKLLQSTWTELLTLQIAYRSIPFNGKILYAKDFWLDERSSKACGATEIYDHYSRLTERLERLAPRKEEYLLLKSLILSNCDARSDNQITLRKFRDSILTALNDCVYLLRQSSAVSHQQQLLLTLPAIRQGDNLIRKFWYDIYREGNISMKKLFIEMLESNPVNIK